ncbi:hypothetical protein OE88DRAFT_1713803 [Heliocybe sulcata]|uniref:U6 snRNA phosphodiesterase 1 n=1 Tax=Heliocybe sulcata TaxID=5364 RepID=A0A5C3MUY7_9AGAM|nr:hypothetical protein OE88DRAFT_1713803 [Heliocybe sulcata]
MKRPLVDYASDSDDGDGDSLLRPVKLPALSGSLAPSVPVDNPALHQGRVRTTPYIEGQYAAYVYVPVTLEPRSKLSKLVGKVYRDAKKSVPILQPMSSSSLDSGESAFNSELPHELHVSLSRPIFLRAHQLDELKRAVKSIAASHSPFTASFATFSNLTNDERTRTFLTLEIGAGHTEFSALSTSLTPHLQALRQKSFYSEPRFHASFAWALLSTAASTTTPAESSQDHVVQQNPASEARASPPPQPSSRASTSTTTVTSPFPTIPALPSTLVPDLIATYASQLASPHVGSFEVTHLCVKLGKTVSQFRLLGGP